MNGIQFRGYAKLDEEMVELDSNKLIFPEDAVGEEPFDFLKKFFKNMGIEYYLITYDKIIIEE
jgi:hypothetical protein